MHFRERKLNIRKRVWLQTFLFQQFHVLFNSLFKVFFIFRSFYLCVIDFWSIFSFRWNISLILSCIFKQFDSSKKLHMKSIIDRIRDSHFLWRFVSRNLNQRFVRNTLYKLQLEFWKNQISNLSCCRFTRRYWDNFCWFFFLRLLICLSSASIFIWFEINRVNCCWLTKSTRCLQNEMINFVRSKSRKIVTKFQTRSMNEIQYQTVFENCNDARTDMFFEISKSAMCVQKFDDSRNSAIHIIYRISLRFSSMSKSRNSLLKILVIRQELRLHRKTILYEFSTDARITCSSIKAK